MRLLAGTALLMMGTTSYAAPPALLGPSDGSSGFEVDVTGDVWWQQLPVGNAIASQDDVCYPFLAEAADDFVGDGDPLAYTMWWGQYFSDPPGTPDGFWIRVYGDEGGVPGDVVYEVFATEYDEEPGDYFRYCSEVTPEFDPVPGVTYHLSIVAVFCYPPQWGWNGAEGNGIRGHFRSEYFGYPDWVPLSDIGFFAELAFVLGSYIDCLDPTPAVNRSWGVIKALYGE